MFNSKLAVLFVAALAVTGVTRAANASVYLLTLTGNTASSGAPISGTGELDISSAFPITGTTSANVPLADVTKITFNIDGVGFGTGSSSPFSLTAVRFTNGVLDDINFAETISGTNIRFTLDTNAVGTPGGYTFTDINNIQTIGTITAVAAVPEPSTWAMMILGFCGLGFMKYRRRRIAA